MPDVLWLRQLKAVKARLEATRAATFTTAPAPTIGSGRQEEVPGCVIYPVEIAAQRAGAKGRAGNVDIILALVEASRSPASLTALWFVVELRVASDATAKSYEKGGELHKWVTASLDGWKLDGASEMCVEVGSSFEFVQKTDPYLGLFVRFGTVYQQKVGDATASG